jgi:hypothetical protein
MPTTRQHACKPPAGIVGLLWKCPDCWTTYLFRPVESGELGRVINLWVKRSEPNHMELTPLRAQRRAAR